ncbi:MAG: hypothetical protein OIF35_02745, partial [Cellvibrionaceae bacterium]|nr:hypothetical protein [Cellvibrionaceae bacterium]
LSENLSCNKPKHQTDQAARQGPTFGSTPPLSSMSATTVVRKPLGHLLGEPGLFQTGYLFTAGYSLHSRVSHHSLTIKSILMPASQPAGQVI